MGISMLLAILAFVLSIMMVIAIHEFGHALAARFFSVKISRVSIGFGKPKISWQSKKSGINWSLTPWLIGGYVHLLNTRVEPVEPEEEAFCFDKKPFYAKAIILSAGCLMNLLMAWLLFIIVFLAGQPYYPPEIASVKPQTIAATAGFHKNDRILEVADVSVHSWRDVGVQLLLNMGKPEVQFKVQLEKEKPRVLTLPLQGWRYRAKDKNVFHSLGIYPDIDKKPAKLRVNNAFSAMAHASQEMLDLLYFYLMLIIKLLMGDIPFSMLLGPLGMVWLGLSSFFMGLIIFCQFIAVLNLAVAVVNLLPVPGLDGSLILYALIEKIRGKAVSIALEVLLYRLAVIAFFVLLVHLVMNDLAKYFS